MGFAIYLVGSPGCGEFKGLLQQSSAVGVGVGAVCLGMTRNPVLSVAGACPCLGAATFLADWVVSSSGGGLLFTLGGVCMCLTSTETISDGVEFAESLSGRVGASTGVGGGGTSLGGDLALCLGGDLDLILANA